MILIDVSTEELVDELRKREAAVEAAKLSAQHAAKTKFEEDRRQALKDISAKTDAAKALIVEAEAIADKVGVRFYFAVDYGMGGTYTPNRPADVSLDAPGDWAESQEDCGSGSTPGWRSSSDC